MSETVWDCIVIGGGPGGSAAATFLAKGGRQVLVLEKEVFPRFHIGESLLPYNKAIFAEMGVLPTLEATPTRATAIKPMAWRTTATAVPRCGSKVTFSMANRAAGMCGSNS